MLETTNDYIECHLENIIISQGEMVKNCKLYSPTKFVVDVEEPLWIYLDDGSDYYVKLSTQHRLCISSKRTNGWYNHFQLYAWYLLFNNYY